MNELTLTPVRQRVSTEEVADVAQTVRAGMAALPLSGQVKPGMRVCVAVGSRGISCYAEVVGAVVQSLLDVGADPFLVPAMGSHGAATAEGQRDVLLGYGMGKLGVPILSSLETVQIGTAPDGMPVLWDRNAADADAVIPVNRVKAHTAFRAPWESGLFKILAIGLGKPEGADIIHAHGVTTAMPKAARVAIAVKPVIAGVAIVENGQHRPARIA
ncbi:MAG TPA: lactate racemase domain-containing protein, partial [Caldilineaceae bacterium]|nr:lactate racemase domain-containing protein [Caldilineaceae bacterium]